MKNIFLYILFITLGILFISFVIDPILFQSLSGLHRLVLSFILELWLIRTLIDDFLFFKKFQFRSCLVSSFFYVGIVLLVSAIAHYSVVYIQISTKELLIFQFIFAVVYCLYRLVLVKRVKQYLVEFAFILSTVLSISLFHHMTELHLGEKHSIVEFIFEIHRVNDEELTEERMRRLRNRFFLDVRSNYDIGYQNEKLFYEMEEYLATEDADPELIKTFLEGFGHDLQTLVNQYDIYLPDEELARFLEEKRVEFYRLVGLEE
ncbi:hypothetical protein [Halalkalibacter urbisdiaboli]|uniref:hypothetical protein n=1 Tax=Halalkalibacter urbisdiaboli TaxID=1960589 RepID=UPI000B44D650|nr:hypothetical protein [Halalkalibacter urbisdiaboli]